MTSPNVQRVKRIEVHPSIILELFKFNGKSWSVLESEIPDNAVFRGCYLNAENGCWSVYFYHESFELVPEGCVTPIIKRPTINTIRLLDQVYEVLDEKN